MFFFYINLVDDDTADISPNIYNNPIFVFNFDSSGAIHRENRIYIKYDIYIIHNIHIIL
jgi:hypothetical protein